MSEVFSFSFAPWLCWIFPFVGALLSLFIGKEEDSRLKGAIASAFTFLGWLMALAMLPEIFHPGLRDIRFGWITLPYGEPVSLGMLLDPLSVILANIVAFISFLVLVYSIKYMEGEPGQARYWALMSFFIGGMLLLVLADNFIFFFIGWKIVGLCSYALIGHYYGDEKKYWIGGPPPHPFQRPSTCGLKALIVTGFGDVSLLAGVLLIYLYAGSFNFLTLYSTTNIWMAEMAQNPGILTLTILLLLGGPIAKSAQFPLHTWLPEAMAGPAPVSALIHAATMVKAGVFIVARLTPIFFKGYWINSFSEAFVFFPLIAAVGAVTAFLTATEAMASLELKKILAYSTMSQIGYMMLALGVAGMSPQTLVSGYAGSLFHLLSHALFKAALFLCAGAVIHATGSIYIHEKGVDRRKMPFTWLFMWLAALSLAGVPPFSGFWSKDEVLAACMGSGQYLLFAAGVLTAAITCFYSIRMMGYIFHSHEAERGESGEAHSESLLMWAPYGILSTLTLGIGIIGFWFSEQIKELFHGYFIEALGLPSLETIHAQASSLATALTPFISIAMLLAGGIPAYMFYISRRSDPWKLVSAHPALKSLHKILWNRWYIDKFYNDVFVRATLLMRAPLAKYAEGAMDGLFNVSFPRFFAAAYNELRKVQTGILSVNMLYVLIFLGTLSIFILLVM